MDKYQATSIGISLVALMVSAVTGYFQYQSSKDSFEERVKLEIKMTKDKLPLSPIDVRMLSGVEEGKSLESAIFVTNTGNTSIRILEVGYHDVDLPKHLYYSGAEDAKILSPGEQISFVDADLFKVDGQLVDDINLGEDKNARIFAVTTKGKRFEMPAKIEVFK